MPIATQIKARGYQSALFYVGILQEAVVLACAYLMRVPQKGDLIEAVVPESSQTTQDFTPVEMLKTPG